MSAWAMAVGKYVCILSSSMIFFFTRYILIIISRFFLGYFATILPTKAIIAGPFLNVLGGECVLQSTIYTLTSALTTEYVQRCDAFRACDDGGVRGLRFLRASYFSYISSTSYVVSFLGPTLASYTMSRSFWLPFWINLALLLCAIPTVGLLPATSKPPAAHAVPQGIPQATDEESGPLLGSTSASSDRHANDLDTHLGIFQRIAHAIRRMRRLITGRRKFQVLLCSFFLTALASSDTKLLVQYISKRYEWTFAQVGVSTLV